MTLFLTVFVYNFKVGSHCSVIIPDSPWLWSVMITDRLWCLCSHCHNTSLMRHWCITEASLMYGAHCLHNPNHNHNSFDLYMYEPISYIILHLNFTDGFWDKGFALDLKRVIQTLFKPIRFPFSLGTLQLDAHCTCKCCISMPSEKKSLDTY